MDSGRQMFPISLSAAVRRPESSMRLRRLDPAAGRNGRKPHLKVLVMQRRGHVGEGFVRIDLGRRDQGDGTGRGIVRSDHGENGWEGLLDLELTEAFDDADLYFVVAAAQDLGIFLNHQGQIVGSGMQVEEGSGAVELDVVVGIVEQRQDFMFHVGQAALGDELAGRSSDVGRPGVDPFPQDFLDAELFVAAFVENPGGSPQIQELAHGQDPEGLIPLVGAFVKKAERFAGGVIGQGIDVVGCERRPARSEGRDLLLDVLDFLGPEKTRGELNDYDKKRIPRML
jgi:hypothetical protein